MATNLNHYLGSTCQHHREEEGKEEESFRRLFGNNITILPGGDCPVTLEALSKANGCDLIIKFSDAKTNFYQSLHQPKFLKGWLNRVASVRADALKMVIG